MLKCRCVGQDTWGPQKQYSRVLSTAGRLAWPGTRGGAVPQVAAGVGIASGPGQAGCYHTLHMCLRYKAKLLEHAGTEGSSKGRASKGAAAHPLWAGGRTAKQQRGTHGKCAGLL